MIHELRLHNDPFEKIKNGTKTIEIRLYDEKRKLIKENDIIEFTNRITNEKIRVKVLKLHLYTSFDELYKDFDNISLGYEENDIKDPKDMEIYYSKEEQCQYGVVGIEIKLI
jgi:ASC-1-like (ASCH) protein